MPEIWSWTSSNFEMRGQGLKISLCVLSKRNPYRECNVVIVFSVAVSPVNEFWCSNFSENLFRYLSDWSFTVEIFEADSLDNSLKKGLITCGTIYEELEGQWATKEEDEK